VPIGMEYIDPSVHLTLEATIQVPFLEMGAACLALEEGVWAVCEALPCLYRRLGGCIPVLGLGGVPACLHSRAWNSPCCLAFSGSTMMMPLPCSAVLYVYSELMEAVPVAY